MTRLRETLTEPRHLAAAVAIGLIVQAASLGAVGFAAAGDGGGDDLPATLELPEPRVGDRGVYNVTVVEETGEDSVRVVEDERTYISFEWFEDRIIRDHAGRRQLVHRIGDTIYQWDEDEQAHTPRPAITEFDATTWERVAYSYADENESVEDEGDTTLTSSREDLQTIFVQPDAQMSTTLCGLRNRFQGQTVPLDGDETIELFKAPCRLKQYWTQNKSFQPVATQEIGGYETVMFTHSDSSGEVHLWLSPDIPYPLRIAVEHQDRPDVFDVIRLTRFERGESPVRLGEEVPEDPLPPIEEGPRHRYGPDEDGIDHPFPASEAWEVAQANETVSAYLEDHPEAYAFRASYRPETDDDRTERTWDLILSDGEDGLSVTVVQRTEPSVDTRPLPAPSALNETTAEVQHARRREASQAPPADAAPDRMPTVASVTAWWRSYRGEDYANATANAWGFTIRCADRDCTGGSIEVSAGLRRDDHRSGSWPGQDQVQTIRKSMLTVSGDGRALDIREHRQRYERSDDPVGPTGSGDGNGGGDDVAIAGSLATPIWTFPAEHAGTIGLVAAITALLYWLWPALKGVGLVGLRTRLTADEALDHPMRRELMDRIAAEPGVHRNELIEALDAGNGTIRHHLDKLVELDHVAETRGQGYACYFPAGAIDRRVMAAAPALRSGSARRVLTAVLDQPGLSNGEVAARTGLSPSTVSHHLARLQEADLVRAGGDGRALELVPTEVAERAVDELGM